MLCCVLSDMEKCSSVLVFWWALVTMQCNGCVLLDMEKCSSALVGSGGNAMQCNAEKCHTEHES